MLHCKLETRLIARSELLGFELDVLRRRERVDGPYSMDDMFSGTRIFAGLSKCLKKIAYAGRLYPFVILLSPVSAPFSVLPVLY